MGDKEIKIGKKTIGEGTQISFSIKTALWIIGITISLFSAIFTAAYIDVKSDVKAYKERVDSEQRAFVKQVEDNIDAKLDKQRDKDEEFIKAIEEIRGNIRLLLDRTQDLRDENVSGTPTIHTNTPSNTIPTNHGH